MDGIDITRAPEAITGRAIGYVGAAAYLFPVSVRENLVYSLKHRPVAEAEYAGDARRARERQLRESARAGNSTLDINAQWLDYDAAGVSGPHDMEDRILEMARTVDLEETLFEIGLRSAVSSVHSPGIADDILRARENLRERLSGPEARDLVERFDIDRYNRNATMAENLLFGTPVGRVFDMDSLALNPYVRKVLMDTGLSADLLKVGHKLAETMLELFSDLPPGHELFERFSFIAYDDLPNVKDILSRVASLGLERIPESERNLLLGLPFKLVVTKHRLGLIDEALEGRILQARRQFAENLPQDMRESIAFFDPLRYNSAASLQDNILFGKIATSQAGGSAQIGALMRQILDELRLRSLVLTIGLDYQVGTGGARLSVPDRQKVAIGRALLKRPSVLILDQASAVLDPAAQNRLVANVLACRKGSAVFWVLNRIDLAQRFDHVLVMEQGKLAEQGAYDELLGRDSTLRRLLKTG
jgi:putative ABC transport system ATP-binding protein